MEGTAASNDDLAVEMLHDTAYIHPTVRREMRILRPDIPPIQPSKLQEISNVLLRPEDFNSSLDDGTVMYI